MKWQTNRRKKQQETRTSRSVTIKIPKSVVMSELKEQSVKQWQREWVETRKGAITKAFFPKIENRMKLRLNTTPNYTTILTVHGNIKSYLYKYKIIDK